MAGRGRTTSSAPRGGHKYPRSARVGETLREIIADELVRIDDERLEFVTVTGIEVDDELNRAHVFFDSLDGRGRRRRDHRGARRDHRIRLQASIAPPDPGEEDADPRLPARRRDPLGRADRRHPPRGSQATRRSAGRRHRHRRLMARKRPADDARRVRRRQAGRRHQPRRGRACCGGASASVRSATPARSTPTPPGVLVVGVGMATKLLRFVETTTQALHGRGRARHRDLHARRRRRGRRHLRHVGGDARRGPRASSPSTSPARSSRSRRWCRRSRSTAVACTSWPARASRSSGRRGPSRSTRFDGRRRRPSRACSRSTCRARPARTSARSPPTSAGCSAVARTCATCAAPPSATFTLADAGPPDDVRAAARGRPRSGRSPRVDVDDATRGAGRQRARAADASTTAPVRGRCSSPAGELIAVYERFHGDDAKPAVVLPTANAWTPGAWHATFRR